jgi:hypothetical protein
VSRDCIAENRFAVRELPMVSATSQRRSSRQKFAIGLLAAQLLTACIAWLIAWFWLETIVGTGPLLTVIGLALALVVRPFGFWMPLLVGLSGPIVCAVGAFTIALFRLSPGEAQRPILIILTIYLLVAVPAAAVALSQILQLPNHPRVGVDAAWRYSMKALLGMMTAAAILTALATATVKTIPDFPIVFGAFGSTAFVLASVVAWRFFIQRRRILNPTMTPRPLNVREWFDAKVFAPFLARTPDVWCSFCGRYSREAGPFVEGRGGSLICGQCAEVCARLVAEQRANLSEPVADGNANDPSAAV